MANNRMWLVNERLGAKALMAKFYPSTGWYAVTNGKNLDALFDADEVRPQFGAEDYRIVFEISDDVGLLDRLKTVTRSDAEEAS